MKTGHHGANHPVKDLDDRRVLITSQNHGFAGDPAYAARQRARDARQPVRRHAAGHCPQPTSRRSAFRAIEARPRAARCGLPVYDRFIDLMNTA